jgi:hypothetical protein
LKSRKEIAMRIIAVFAVLAFVPSIALADDEVAPVKTVIRDRDRQVDVPPPPKVERVESVSVARPVVPPPVVVVAKPPPKPRSPNEYVVPNSVAYEGGRIPKEATLTKQPNMALVGAGLGVIATAYIPSVITAAVSCPPQADCIAKGAGWLYLPVVGPFITAAMAPTIGGAALAAFDGGIQTTGAVLAIAGLVAQKKFVVWQDKTTSLHVTPGAGANAGISITLTHL